MQAFSAVERILMVLRDKMYYNRINIDNKFTRRKFRRDILN